MSSAYDIMQFNVEFYGKQKHHRQTSLKREKGHVILQDLSRFDRDRPFIFMIHLAYVKTLSTRKDVLSKTVKKNGLGYFFLSMFSHIKSYIPVYRKHNNK